MYPGIQVSIIIAKPHLYIMKWGLWIIKCLFPTEFKFLLIRNISMISVHMHVSLSGAGSMPVVYDGTTLQSRKAVTAYF